MHYLHFELSEGSDEVFTLEAMASMREAAGQSAALSEAQQVLDWAWKHFPSSHGPVEEGLHWDHVLESDKSSDGWYSVALTLSASRSFVEAFTQHFGAWML